MVLIYISNYSVYCQCSIHYIAQSKNSYKCDPLKREANWRGNDWLLMIDISTYCVDIDDLFDLVLDLDHDMCVCCRDHQVSMGRKVAKEK